MSCVCVGNIWRKRVVPLVTVFNVQSNCLFSVLLQAENKIRNLKLAGHVGFDTLPDQLVSKSVQCGFNFNILCVGETGLGKSTLMDSLFNTSFESNPSPHSLAGVKLKSHTYELQESNVKLKVTAFLVLLVKWIIFETYFHLTANIGWYNWLWWSSQQRRIF